MRPRSLEDPVPWVWDPRRRAFVLPRTVRLAKRPRRLARQELRRRQDRGER